MKPAAFEYHRVDTVEDALERLGELGEDAKLLAGGQSLVPMMNFRIVRPPALVDISRVPDLDYIAPDGDGLRVGALTLHRELEHADDELLDGFGVLKARRAARRAHADPLARHVRRARWRTATPRRSGACSRSCSTGRSSPAAPRASASSPPRISSWGSSPPRSSPARSSPRSASRSRCASAAIEEFARRHGDFAIVAVAAGVESEDGTCRRARVVAGGVDEVPLRIEAAEEILVGSDLGEEAIEEAAQVAAGEVEPASDVHGSAGYRKQLTAVLLRRALRKAVGDGR